MSAHDWKILGSFGLLLGALSLFSPKLAVSTATIATVVVIVKNGDKVSEVLT